MSDAEPSVKFATKDHKPDDPEETKRINNSGGFVSLPPQTYIPRVNGQLALSRAFGDFQLKMSNKVEQVIYLKIIFKNILIHLNSTNKQ